jgi:hypothetical protein
MDKLITTAFVISESDLARIKAEGDRRGLNKSASLRLIVREWAEMRRAYVTGITELPHPEGAQSVPVLQIARNE